MEVIYGTPEPTDPRLLKKYERKLFWERLFVKLFWRFLPKYRKEHDFKLKCEEEAARSKLQLEEMILKRKEEKEKRSKMFKTEGVK